jgi:hypothetical protein
MNKKSKKSKKLNKLQNTHTPISTLQANFEVDLRVATFMDRLESLDCGVGDWGDCESVSDFQAGFSCAKSKILELLKKKGGI